MNIADRLLRKSWGVVDERAEKREMQGQYDQANVYLAAEKRIRRVAGAEKDVEACDCGGR